MAIRRVSGKPRTGETTNQANFFTDIKSVLASAVVDPGGSIGRVKRGKNVFDFKPYVIVGVHFEDAGADASIEAAQACSASVNTDGTFTIYCKKLTLIEGTPNVIDWVPSTVARVVRWTILLA